MKKEECYSALGLSSNASEDEAKKKFRELSKQYHPDVCKEPDANEKFKKINEAYDCIKNNTFDDNRAAGFGGSPFGGNPFGGVGINLNDIFNFSNWGQPRAKRNFPPIEVRTETSFQEAVLGCKKQIVFKRHIKCENCNGQGASIKDNGCAQCHGSGKVTRRQGNMIMTSPCSKCRGQVNSEPCQVCKSEGSLASDTTIQVNIPPGVFQNTLRLSDIGHYQGSSPFGDDYGDVYVHVQAQVDTDFEIEDSDLVIGLQLSLAEALEGKTSKIKTIDGEKEITIPPLSKNGEEIVLPRMGVARTGNQRVVLNVSYPQDILTILPQIKELSNGVLNSVQ